MTRDRVSALFFLALSIAYGLLSQDIELYPGSEEEPFTARSFPLILAWSGAVIAFLILVSPPGREVEAETIFGGRYWGRVVALCFLMVAYGLAIKSVGFFISTTLFLMAGFRILGERRWKVLVFVPLPVAGAFQFVLHGLLGIYIVDPALKALGIIQ